MTLRIAPAPLRVRRIVNDVAASEKSNSLLKKFSGALVLILLAMTGALFGVSYAGGRVPQGVARAPDPAIAPTHAALPTLPRRIQCPPLLLQVKSDGTMLALSGEVTRVDTVESHTTLWDMPAVSVNTLAKLKEVTMFVDMSADPAVGGWVEATFKVEGAYKASADKVFLQINSADTITINRAALSGTLRKGGVDFPISDKHPGRRALAEMPATLKPVAAASSKTAIFRAP